MARVPRLAVAAAAFGLVLTGLIALAPFAAFAIENAAARASIETGQAVIVLLVAYLVVGRLVRDRLRTDFMLALALILAAAGNVVLAVGAAVGVGGEGVFTTWAALLLRGVSAALLVSAALGRDRPLPTRRPIVALALVACVVTAVALAAVGLAHDLLPGGVAELTDPRRPAPDLDATSALLWAQGGLVALYTAAAVGFARRATASSDGLVAAFAIGTALAAVARFNVVLYPALYTSVVHAGDVFRLAFYLVLLWGAMREIRRYWQGEATKAVLEERRRIARDLHDGLAQELAFIHSHSAALAAGKGTPQALALIADASERALRESRRAVTVLGMTRDVPLHAVLGPAAQELTSRSSVRLVLDLDESIEVQSAVAQHLARVVRESVDSAIRHSGPDQVEVRAWTEGGTIRVVVADDGQDFETSQPGKGSDGLTAVQEHVEALGGDVRLRSTPGEGTTVDITLPTD